MVREERKDYLLEKNDKFINYLNTIIGADKDKIMSNRGLARLIGCSNSTVTRWLKKECPMSIDMAFKICDILNIDKSEYLNYTDLTNNKIVSNISFINLNQNIKFNNLSKKNQEKVYEYIDFLLYNQEEKALQKIKGKEM